MQSKLFIWAYQSKRLHQCKPPVFDPYVQSKLFIWARCQRLHQYRPCPGSSWLRQVKLDPCPLAIEHQDSLDSANAIDFEFEIRIRNVLHKLFIRFLLPSRHTRHPISGHHPLQIRMSAEQDLRRIIYTEEILLNLTFEERELGCCLTVNTLDVIICRLEYCLVLRFAHRFVLLPILPLTSTTAVKLVADRTFFTGVITAHTARASDWK